jgi:hypothetical protein
MKRSSGFLALAAIAAACGALFLGEAQGQVQSDGTDPSTPYGQSVIQNQQYQQQEQQNERQDQQNQQQLQDHQRQMNDANPQWQQPQAGYQSYNQMAAPQGGVYGAIYVDPTNPATSRTSWNFSSADRARAMAKGACYGASGRTPCTFALDFHNACAAIAHANNRVWAARAAGSLGVAQAEAMAACRRAGGQSCVVNTGVCSPNDD